jgi:hypothetical protein
VETDGPIRVGPRATNARRMPGGTRDITFEINERDPPRRVPGHERAGTAGPDVTLEPLDKDSRTRLTMEMDLKARGSGVLLALLGTMSARKVISQDHRKLRANLERGT